MENGVEEKWCVHENCMPSYLLHARAGSFRLIGSLNHLESFNLSMLMDRNTASLLWVQVYKKIWHILKN